MTPYWKQVLQDMADDMRADLQKQERAEALARETTRQQTLIDFQPRRRALGL